MPRPRPDRPLRVCAFLASSHGDDPSFDALARDAGAAIAARGLELVYGGGHVGTMGVLADAAVRGGARVTGVIPAFMEKVELAHRGVADLLVVDSMHARKGAMHAMADGYLVLPGGLGTLEELSEAWTWVQLGLVEAPIVLLDPDGFWTPLLDWARGAAARGMVSETALSRVEVAATPDEALDRIVAAG